MQTTQAYQLLAQIGARFARRAFSIAFLLAAVTSLAHAADADLVVNIDDSPDPGPAGGVYTYTVRVDNNGPSATTGAMLADTLPAGATFLAATATQGACTFSAPTVNCAFGGIAFLQSATATITVRLPASGVYTSTFSATSDLNDPNTSNNLSIPEDTTVKDAADMALVVSAPAGPLAAGASYSYQLTASNLGPNALGPTDTREIAFDVPAGACVTAAPSGSGWSCTGPASYPACNGEAIACTRTGALAVNASDPVLTVNAVANVAGTIAAEFDVSSSLPDGDLANNTATADTAVSGASADLALSKAASPATVAVGSNVTYTLTPRLNGGVAPGSTGNGEIVVTDTLPAGVTLVSVTPADPAWVCEVAAPTVTCTMQGPYTGANFHDMPKITIVASVDAIGTPVNSAVIGAPESDPNLANNTASATVTGSNSADLQVTKTASLKAVVPDQPFTFTMTARNNGPLAMVAGQTVTITDTLPVNFTLTGQPAGSGWTCPALTLPAAGPLTFTCARTLAANVNSGTNFPAITVAAETTTNGAFINSACGVLTGAGPSDDTPANDCGSVSVTSTASASAANLQIAKSASPGTVKAGELLTYTIDVVNNGPGDATNVVVTDALASLVAGGGLSSVSVAVTGGASSGVCSPLTSNSTSVTLTCTFAAFPMGATAAITVAIKPSIAVTGTRNNTATVNSDVGDSDRTDNTATATATVTAVADMQVTKSASPNPVHGGAPLTYQLTAKNNGPSTAVNAIATDVLPANAVFLSASASGTATCTKPNVGDLGGTISCKWATIASGAQQTITYVVRPLATASGGSVANSATVSNDTEDTTLGNNSTSVTTPVSAPLLDILVNKVDSVDPVPLGGTTRYTITINNQGPSYGTHLHMVDVFPSQSPTATFSYQGNLTVTPAAFGSCSQPANGATTGTLDCQFPGIDAGQTIVVAYDMRAEAVASGISGTGFNTVNVSVDETETQTGNNQAIESTTSRRTADLALVKTGPPTVEAGKTISYILTVTNNGPNPSTGASVVDVLPAGLTFSSASPGCTHVGASVTCTLGSIAALDSATVTITAQVANPFNQTLPLTNNATVTAVNEIDAVPSNNSGGTQSDVTPNDEPPPPTEVPTLPWQGLAMLAALVAIAGIRLTAIRAGSVATRRRQSTRR